MERVNKLQENKNVDKTSLKEYSEKVRGLMVRKRLRKYGVINMDG